MESTFFARIKSLKEYRPSKRHFTTKEDMDKVAEALGLEGASASDLCNIRDMVVLMFDKWSERCYINGETYEGHELFNAMLSITAVIDHYKVSKGLEA